MAITQYGFKLLQEKKLAETGGIAKVWEHEQSGAQVLSICNDDENKCFGANFFTPPDNSTGVAHILEHSVLCGSERFPVREPFVELLKGSLQTFLNAFTFPDKTCYPVASANLQDFYNLVEVYLDAVFKPLLSKRIFEQEGWHVEALEADSPWTFKGVVYNEMKGVYSSPDSVLAEMSQQAIFPDNLYSLDSGGNPEVIPSLTYEAFRDFHKRFYQPGNTRFFFWGDDPEEKRFQLILPYIEGHDRPGYMPAVNLQKPFNKASYVEVPYAADAGENRALFTMNWLLGERGDVALALKMEMLEHILEGLPGSPLRKALIESGLGEDTTGSGLETDLRQMYYSTGLKGIAPAAVGQADELILDTLKGLVKNGIPEEDINAALNSVEFAYRENNSGRFPRGLAAMIQALSTWLYGGDPLAPLAWEEPLAKLRASIQAGEKIFEKAIQEYFLDNPSRARVTLLPSAELAEARNRRENAILAEIQDSSSPAARAMLVQETINLQEAQLAPDNPEDLAKIPTLTIADLPSKNRQIPRKISSIPQTFISHELPTQGIIYASLLLPIKRMPSRLLPLMPLFCRSFMDWGTKNKNYAQLGTEAASVLGGLSVSTLLGNKWDSKEIYSYLNISGKAVYANMQNLFDLMRQIVLEPQQDHAIILSRLAEMLPEEKARLERGLNIGGHATAAMRVNAHFRGTDAWTETTSGIFQLRFLKQLENRLKQEPEGVISDFMELRQLIIGAQDAIFDCAAEKEVIDQARKNAEKLFASLPPQPVLDNGMAVVDWPAMRDLPHAEAFTTPGLINYVAKGANLYDLGYTYKGSANVILRWLRMARLWEEVRVAGGAYGAFCTLNKLNGNYVCSSYRDPNVDKTLSAYDGLAPYLRSFNPSQAQLSQAIIGAVGDIDAYLLPDARATKSLLLYLAGIGEEEQQKQREEMLSTTGADFHEFADVLEAASNAGAICVIGGENTRKAAEEHGWKMEKLILGEEEA